MRSLDDDDLRLIEASEWARQRWGWLEGVRRDGALNDNAKMVAHTLVLDFCNTETMRCDPSYKQISDLKGGSPDTAKRGVQALEEAGWITRLPGAGRGNYTVYGFLTRAKILAIKGGRFAPPKGGKSARVSGSEKGANLHGKGGKSAFVHNIAKPWNNHNGDAPQNDPKKAAVEGAEKQGGQASSNPMVQDSAKRAVASWRGGRLSAFDDLQPWVLKHIIASGLLSDDELAKAGFSNEGGKA